MTTKIDDWTMVIGDMEVVYDPGMIRITWASGLYYIADTEHMVFTTGHYVDESIATVDSPLTNGVMARIGALITAQRRVVDAVGAS